VLQEQKCFIRKGNNYALTLKHWRGMGRPQVAVYSYCYSRQAIPTEQGKIRPSVTF